MPPARHAPRGGGKILAFSGAVGVGAALANPIRPHPHAATKQKTAEPVPPCTAARREELWKCSACDYRRTGTGGVSADGKREKTAAASNKQTVLQAADTPPVPVRMWSEHAFHNSPAAPPYREGPAPPFSSPPHKIIQKEYKKIHFFFDRIFYYKGTSFMNETKRCISKSKNHIQTDKT